MHDEGIRIIGRGLWYISAVYTDEDISDALDVAEKVVSKQAHMEKGFSVKDHTGTKLFEGYFSNGYGRFESKLMQKVCNT